MTGHLLRYLLALALLLGCGESSPSATVAPSPSPPTVAPAAPSTAELLADADARRLSPALTSALAHRDPSVRRVAALALARLHDPAAAPLLASALRDPDPWVRDSASLGLGALEAAAPDSAPAVLLGALAAEVDPALRGALLEDLGRLASDEALAAFPAALASDHPEERRGACRGLGAVGLRNRTLAPDLLRRISTRVVDDTNPGVRLACAYALTRLPAPEPGPDRDGIGSDLLRALQDPDAEARAMAYRALTRYPGGTLERLAEGTRDPDWPVAVHATRTLAVRAAAEHGEATLAAVLRQALAALVASGDVAPGGPLHVFLTTTDALAPSALDPAVHAAAQEALARLARVPEDVPPSRDRGLAHCAAARLVDLGRAWPSRVDRCGLEQVSEPERGVLAAGILGLLEGAEPQRAVYLARLLRHEASPVRQAALTAAGAVEHPDMRAAVLRAVRGEADLGARITALEALRTIAARRSQRLATAVLSGAVMTDDWPQAEVAAALLAAGEAVVAADDLEGLITWLGVAGEIAPRELIEVALPLAAHPNLAVRAAVRALASEAGAELPDLVPRPVASPLDTAAISASPSARAIVESDRGRFVIALRPRDAPTTVARFAELVRAGFFDGLSFHRVVPAFVVQGGDPRGDGYGGPGWSQRCEDHRQPYERGTVGMALSGRDTGGSQFFVTLGPQPHLDARYTAFGTVVEGMDVVERLQAGDRIRSIRLDASEQEPTDR